jgi:hypothetical protein
MQPWRELPAYGPAMEEMHQRLDARDEAETVVL